MLWQEDDTVRKRTFAKWAALGSLRGICFMLRWSRYNKLSILSCIQKKEVNSFDNLQKILRNTPGVFYRMFPQKSSTVGNMH